ncbi:BC1872 family protein [Brevibacillus fulvus]|uniref:Phage ABA sandwich domain-containing protein n=1 Tax=Brevibacillus fulvus TaxID=1125967 RepID=A0A939BWY1_9BACL|nr:hypothetical protein [Brevibacillus fulvus]MBM7592276.1 hypothetical protein [Brevibacillus fulvus]
MAFYDKNSYLENDVIGNFLNENCPKCGATLLGNKRGDKWCSNAGGVGTSVCEYGLKDEPSDQQIITELAKKVMGWHREIHFRDLEDQYGDTYWVDKTGLAVAKDGLWNPLQNIADAFMLLKKLKHMEPVVYYVEQTVVPDKVGWGCNIGGEVIERGHHTAQEAICHAVYRMVKRGKREWQ